MQKNTELILWLGTAAAVAAITGAYFASSVLDSSKREKREKAADDSKLELVATQLEQMQLQIQVLMDEKHEFKSRMQRLEADKRSLELKLQYFDQRETHSDLSDDDDSLPSSMPLYIR